LAKKKKSKLKDIDRLEDKDLKLAKFLIIYYERSPTIGYEITKFFKVSKKILKIIEEIRS